MGRLRNHAIIVSSWHDDEIQEAHREAERIFPDVSGIVKSVRNGVQSFLVPPDGSKEGWKESNQGNDRRMLFIGWLRERRSSFERVEVQYGDEDHNTKTLASSDDDYLAQKGGR